MAFLKFSLKGVLSSLLENIAMDGGRYVVYSLTITSLVGLEVLGLLVLRVKNHWLKYLNFI